MLSGKNGLNQRSFLPDSIILNYLYKSIKIPR